MSRKKDLILNTYTSIKYLKYCFQVHFRQYLDLSISNTYLKKYLNIFSLKLTFKYFKRLSTITRF